MEKPTQITVTVNGVETLDPYALADMLRAAADRISWQRRNGKSIGKWSA